MRRVPLQVKLAAGLLVLVLTPLLVAAYLVDQIGKVGANFGANESAARDQALEQSADVYRKYFETTHALHAEIARRLAARVDIAPLAQILQDEGELAQIEVVGADGKVLDHAERPAEATEDEWQITEAEHPLADGRTLRLGFPVPIALKEQLKAIGEIQKQQREIQKVRTALPRGYEYAFLALVGLAAVIAVLLGVLASRLVTTRIDALVATARKVAAGDGGARANLRGTDEMAELAAAINQMLDGLERQRGEIEYLQRIGAWQDVARKLAHEIKNPLTPIQLAVQQCVSAYAGDDARFKKLLADTGEIVEEEIAGLRRLVDTFRTLGQLPRVEAHPLPLAEVIQELKLDPALAERLRIAEPGGDAAAVTISADKLLLKRVLSNLVENGVHAGQEAGKPGDVAVTWAAAARDVTITVDDQGKGVAADDRERIFEPYVTTKATGTGLGLAIAKKIALEHGGTLEVAAARAPTGGARFVLTLPLDQIGQVKPTSVT
jgi:two-component system nitrogen regulation sensor histidine kinase NtrY